MRCKCTNEMLTIQMNEEVICKKMCAIGIDLLNMIHLEENKYFFKISLGKWVTSLAY